MLCSSALRERLRLRRIKALRSGLLRCAVSLSPEYSREHAKEESMFMIPRDDAMTWVDGRPINAINVVHHTHLLHLLIEPFYIFTSWSAVVIWMSIFP